MSFFQALRHRVRVVLDPRRHERELDEEIRFHLGLDAMQREHAAHGQLSAVDARDAARRTFGNITSIREETRQMAGLGFFDMAQQDVRFALRSFRRTPAFTLVAVLTLAIGIGANTAIFSAVNALLLRPLPFRDPARLIKVNLTVPARGSQPARSDAPWSYPKFKVFRDAQQLFDQVTVYTDDQNTVRTPDQTERAGSEVVDSHYLPVLGVQPALGRNFAPEEDRNPGGPRVVMLGDDMWKRMFNADPAVLGKTLNIDDAPYTIVGVLPPGFRGLSGHAEFFVSLLSHPADELNQAWSHSFDLVARLKPGVSVEQAKVVVPQLGARVDAAYPHPEIHTEHWGAIARELDATRVDPVIRRTLLVLLGAVGIVLLIACANVANLFLVRADGRRREIAVRLAVGAGRGRLIRQLLTESLLLSVLGGAASVALAWWGVSLLSSLEPARALRIQRISGLGAVNFSMIHLDIVALAFAAALAIGTGLVFGLIPALQATRPSLTVSLKDDGALTRAVGHRGLSSRNLLAIVEIALALVLLVGSGLMLRSLGKLLGVHPGFDADRVLTMRLNTREGFGNDTLPGFYDRVLERLAALPGVTGVALGDCPPLNGGCNGTDLLRRDRPRVAPGLEPDVGVHWVTPSWPGVMRVPLLRGRLFTRADRMGAPKVIMITEATARTIWPGEDPIGMPVSVGQGGFDTDTATVIGVLADVRFGTPDSLPKPEVFLSYYQSPRGRMMINMRTSGDPLSVARAARRAIHEIAPDLPLYDVRTLRSRVSDAMSYATFSALLLALFAIVALALATMGTYGVIAYAVSQRTREIGVRVALGATRGDVVRLVVGQGIGLAVAGAGVGLLIALAATRVLRSLLFDVAPTDPTTFAAIVAVLALAVLLASWIPARRAAGVMPSEALRQG